MKFKQGLKGNEGVSQVDIEEKTTEQTACAKAQDSSMPRVARRENWR